MSQSAPPRTAEPLVHLRFASHAQPVSHPQLAGVIRGDLPAGRLREGTPILLDHRWQPLRPWLQYFRHLAMTVGTSTLRNYGYDALRFAGFLAGRGSDVVTASPDDIVAYRDHRLRDVEKPVTSATWQRESVIIRGVYSFLEQTGQIDQVPWITIGRATPLTNRWTTEPDIRPLTQTQWRVFRDIGLGGDLPDGGFDPSWRGQNPMRAKAGAQLAVTTGMRVGEFSSLMDVELPANTADGASLLLEASAKFQKRRRVHVPAETLRLIDLYRATERRRHVEASRASLRARQDELYLVKEIDLHTRTIRGSLNGTPSTWRFHLFPPELRRIAVTDRGAGLEALGLFLGRGGLPISLRAWHDQFDAASRRVRELAPDRMGGRHSKVTPHDLRHTFAVVLLKALTARAIAHESARQTGVLGPATISEHIALNPRLTVQRLLGHSNPATTMVYLRYIEDTDALIQDVFEGWEDEGKSFAELILESRGAR